MLAVPGQPEKDRQPAKEHKPQNHAEIRKVVQGQPINTSVFSSKAMAKTRDS